MTGMVMIALNVHKTVIVPQDIDATIIRVYSVIQRVIQPVRHVQTAMHNIGTEILVWRVLRHLTVL